MSGVPIVCIYHANCLDGLAAAWVVKKYFWIYHPQTTVSFIPGHYERPVLDIKNSVVYLVDFSYKREDMLKLKAANKTVIVLDHHETAAKEIGDLWPIRRNCSGAMIAWEHFFENTPAPEHIALIQDRDLWRFEFPETKAFTMGAFTFPFTLEGMDRLFDTPVSSVVMIGKPLLDKQESDLSLILPHVRRMTFNGFDVPVVNANYMFVSELGDRLSENEPFVVIYSDQASGRKFSLRSKQDLGVLVNELCEQFDGGGGHKHAASFTLPYGDPRFAKSHVFLKAKAGTRSWLNWFFRVVKLFKGG